MKKLILTIAFLTSIAACFSQTITQVEEVFGGRINAITSGAIGTSTDSFRIIVSTESANSIFYATCVVPSAGATTIDSFIVLPSANSTIGFGSAIQKIAYHATSQKIFFISNGNIYSTTTTAASATKITTTGGYIDIKVIRDSIVLLTQTGTNNTIYLGNVSAAGNITLSSNTTIAGNSLTNLIIGKNNKLYVFRGNTTDPMAIAFGGKFTTAINLGVTNTDNMASLSNLFPWATMGVADDGSVFVGGFSSTEKLVAYTNTFGTGYLTVNTAIAGGAGNNIEFRTVTPGNYYVYFGAAYSNNRGILHSWNTIGNVSFMTHPNDGQVHFVAENNLTGGTLLLTTDQGLGITKNSGPNLIEADKGINAVQVKDFDMNTAKNFGWLASKSGIRYVENYGTSAKTWSKALFPNGDGSPYYACDMISEDTAFVGNLRVYKTNNRGSSWTQVFTAENAPYNFPSTYNHISSIAIGGTNKEVVMAGYKFENNAGKGGVFYSVDSGKNWNQLLISATVVGQDVDVNDIEIVSDSGKVVAYIGVNYDNTKSPIVRGMYKAQWDGTSWTVREENIYGAATSLFSVRDIVIYSKDTIVAGGAFYNPVLKHEYPIHFAISRSVMNQWRSSIVDTGRVGTYTAMSFKNDTIFYSFSNNIYWDRLKFHSTYTSRVGEALYYAVPVGTEINVLYYDELLAGTETDIRSVRGATTRRPTATQASRATACAGTQITGGNPSGGVYYLVDSTANGYTVFQNNRYRILFATLGIITGETSMDFAEAELSNFSALHLVQFTPLVYYPNTLGNYAIAYTLNTYAASSVANNVRVNSSAVSSVQPITGSTVNCGATGSFTNLYNTTPNGTWASSNVLVATVNATGKVTATGFGNTLISYTVNSGGCSAAAIANYYVAGLPTPNEITGANNVCVGATIQLSNTTIGGVWSSIAGRATVNANGLVTGQSIGSLATIKYTIAANGCSSFVTKNIIINAIPATPSIGYKAPFSNPQQGAPTSGFCVGKVFGVLGSPSTGVWSTTGCISVTTGGIATINTSGAGSLTYTYTDGNGCANSRTMTGAGYTCAARGTTLINNEKQETINEFSMFPNPARSSVNLKVETLVGEGQIIVTDLYGKTVKKQALSIGNNTVNLASLTKGMYFISTITSEGKTTKKLVVE